MQHTGISFTSMLPLGYLCLTRTAGRSLQLPNVHLMKCCSLNLS